MKMSKKKSSQRVRIVSLLSPCCLFHSLLVIWRGSFVAEKQWKHETTIKNNDSDKWKGDREMRRRARLLSQTGGQMDDDDINTSDLTHAQVETQKGISENWTIEIDLH